MSEPSSIAIPRITDLVAMQIQELHTAGKLGGTQPLLRIDNRDQAAQAPFQFDVATGRLHRVGCKSIPKRSLSAIYGVWRIGHDEQRLACPRCKPVAQDNKPNDRGFPADLLYGVLSIVSQFGGVIRERGQEYRDSLEGRVLGAQLEHFYRDLGEREKKVLDVVLTSLDGLVNTIRDLDSDLRVANGHDANGHGVSTKGVDRPEDSVGRSSEEKSTTR